jgi:urease accessory protein
VSLLRLLHLASPALPIGSFHFSQGLEYAVTAGWIRDEQSASDWIDGLAECALGKLDLPVLQRLYEACKHQRYDEVQRWNAHLIASRETSELRAEDLHMGAALAKVLAQHGIDVTPLQLGRPTYASVFAFACCSWNASCEETLTTYAWTWTENQVLAAIKLVPLGQSAGQRILHRLTTALPTIIAPVRHVRDEDIGVQALMHSVASARHESQYTRLFRS